MITKLFYFKYFCNTINNFFRLRFGANNFFKRGYLNRILECRYRNSQLLCQKNIFGTID
jgi:hypothetical protein